MKFIKKISVLTAVIVSIFSFNTSLQANELVKAEAINNNDFTIVAHSMVKKSFEMTNITTESTETYAKNILGNEVTPLNTDIQMVAKATIVAE